MYVYITDGQVRNPKLQGFIFRDVQRYAIGHACNSYSRDSGNRPSFHYGYTLPRWPKLGKPYVVFAVLSFDKSCSLLYSRFIVVLKLFPVVSWLQYEVVSSNVNGLLQLSDITRNFVGFDNFCIVKSWFLYTNRCLFTSILQIFMHLYKFSDCIEYT